MSKRARENSEQPGHPGQPGQPKAKRHRQFTRFSNASQWLRRISSRVYARHKGAGTVTEERARRLEEELSHVRGSLVFYTHMSSNHMYLMAWIEFHTTFIGYKRGDEDVDSTVGNIIALLWKTAEMLHEEPVKPEDCEPMVDGARIYSEDPPVFTEREFVIVEAENAVRIFECFKMENPPDQILSEVADLCWLMFQEAFGDEKPDVLDSNFEMPAGNELADLVMKSW